MLESGVVKINANGQNMDSKSTISLGVIGSATTAVTQLASRLDYIEQWVRIAGLTAGFIVTLLTGILVCIRIYRNIMRKRGDPETDQ